MENKRMKNIMIGLGAFTLITLGLGKFFDSRCNGSCIGEAFAANTKDGLDGLGNFNIVFDDDDRITIRKGDGPNIHITTSDSDSLGGDEDNAARVAAPITESMPGKDLKSITIKSFVTNWKVVESPDDQIRFVFRGYLPPKEWTVTNDGSKLELEVTKKGPLSGDVQLPRSFAGAVTFTTISGDVSVEALAQTQDFHLMTVSGDLNVKAASAKTLSMNTVSGDVTFQPVSVQKDLHVVYNSVSGDLDATVKTPIKEFEARSVSGDVELRTSKNVGFDFQMEGVSASFEGLPSDTQERTGFGNRSATGSFGAGPKGKLTFNSVSGEFTLKSAE